MSSGEVRRTVVAARSTDTFGRVLLSARDQHFVIDGPVHNGCPGEAVTPPEAFLAPTERQSSGRLSRSGQPRGCEIVHAPEVGP